MRTERRPTGATSTTPSPTAATGRKDEAGSGCAPPSGKIRTLSSTLTRSVVPARTLHRRRSSGRPPITAAAEATQRNKPATGLQSTVDTDKALARTARLRSAAASAAKPTAHPTVKVTRPITTPAATEGRNASITASRARAVVWGLTTTPTSSTDNAPAMVARTRGPMSEASAGTATE